MKKVYLKLFYLVFAILLFTSCATVPPEVIKTHQMELEIIKSLQKSHMAMVDAFVDQKVLAFEDFFFKKYGPYFKKEWVNGFKNKHGREYDPETDFSLLYNDLVAVYQAEISPIEEIRDDLKKSIAQEYSNAIAANITVDKWLITLKDLNDSQQNMINSFLGSINPGLSMETIDAAITAKKEELITRIQ